MDERPIRVALRQLEGADAEANGRIAARAYRDPKERNLFLRWHKRYAVEAERLQKELARGRDKVRDPTFKRRVREAAISQAYLLLAQENDDNVLILAMELFEPEDVARGLVRVHAGAGATPDEIQRWSKAVARYEAGWCAAFEREIARIGASEPASA